jgi:hypothetical protein
MSFVSPQRLTSSQLTRALHDSLLQGNTLPSRGPRHPRPAPLALQVLVSQHVIDWVEGLGFVLHTSRQDQDKSKRPPIPPSPNHLVRLVDEDSNVKCVLVPNLLAFSLCDFI